MVCLSCNCISTVCFSVRDIPSELISISVGTLQGWRQQCQLSLAHPASCPFPGPPWLTQHPEKSLFGNTFNDFWEGAFMSKWQRASWQAYLSVYSAWEGKVVAMATADAMAHTLWARLGRCMQAPLPCAVPHAVLSICACPLCCWKCYMPQVWKRYGLDKKPVTGKELYKHRAA